MCPEKDYPLKISACAAPYCFPRAHSISVNYVIVPFGFDDAFRSNCDHVNWSSNLESRMQIRSSLKF